MIKVGPTLGEIRDWRSLEEISKSLAACNPPKMVGPDLVWVEHDLLHRWRHWRSEVVYRLVTIDGCEIEDDSARTTAQILRLAKQRNYRRPPAPIAFFLREFPQVKLIHPLVAIMHRPLSGYSMDASTGTMRRTAYRAILELSVDSDGTEWIDCDSANWSRVWPKETLFVFLYRKHRHHRRPRPQ